MDNQAITSSLFSPSKVNKQMDDGFVKGLDFSYFQKDVNWATVKERGIDYVILRYYNGLAKDLRYEEYLQGARNANIPIIQNYVVFYPQNDTAKQLAKLESSLFTWIDVEVNKKPGGGSYTAKEYTKLLRKLLDGFEDKFNYTPGIYTRATFWNPNTTGNDWNRYPLWIALYNETVKHPWIGLNAMYKPRGWNDYVIHQYSADGNFKAPYYGSTAHHIDINRIKRSWYEKFLPKVEPEQPQEERYTFYLPQILK